MKNRCMPAGRTALRLGLVLGAVATGLPWSVDAGSAAQPRPTTTARAAPPALEDLPPNPLAVPCPPGRSPAVWALLDEHVNWLMRESPTWASQRGDRRFEGLLSDESPAAYHRRAREMRDRLARARAFDRAGLSPDDLLDLDLLIYELDMALQAAAFFPEQQPVSNRTGPQVWLPQMGDSLPFSQRADFESYVQRLSRVPAQIDQHIEQMREGLRAGRVPPRITVVAAPRQALAQGSETVVGDPTTSPFYAPLRRLDPQDDLAREAQRLIREEIAPAYVRLGEFLRDEYLPAARESTAAGDSIDGRAWYDHALRDHTTLDLGARRIHEIGLAEVARIRAEMLRTIARTDFGRSSDLSGDALLAAFIEHLRTDPRFYHTTPEALLDEYLVICKRIDPELPRLFGLLPRNTYGVRPMPAFAAAEAPTAYYYPGSSRTGVPGWFVANTFRLDQRPRYEMIALSLHEAVPGHHFQIALAQELEGVHPLRTLLGYTAFVEGWALYAERLGLEMGPNPGHPDEGGGGGLFADPYDDFGRLTYEMWRACRLVVDTGIHALGWSRQQAIDYMLENTALSPLNIEREVDRYIAWPGQATAYKIGELKIRELRARAESALGESFDLRAFHDAVLGAGPMPLPVLEARIDRWIESRQAR